MKPIVLTFIGCYWPGYRAGGPIRTITNMVDRLGDEFDFRVVTQNRDLGEINPYPNIEADCWTRVGKAEVFYASPQNCSISSIYRLMRDTPHDLLYLHGFFDPIFTLKPLLVRRISSSLRKPTIVAPHGDLAIAALKIKRLKKMAFVAVERKVELFEGVIWHASTIFEASDIQRERKVASSRVRIAANLVSKNSCSDDFEKIKKNVEYQKLSVCFLSRISPMKNLKFALKVLADVNAKIEFDIYGPAESIPYWEECQNLIKRLPNNITATYKGVVDPNQVRNVLQAYDVFFVPSQGENFGHVFIEALSAGVPILVSDKTPWRHLLDKNIGWDISLESPEKFVAVLESISRLDINSRLEMSSSCIKFAKKTIESDEVFESNRELFLNLLN